MRLALASPRFRGARPWIGVATGLLALAAAGCAVRMDEPATAVSALARADRLLAAGDYGRAAAAYEAHRAAGPGAPEADRALWQLAVLSLLPDTGIEDREHGRELLRELIAKHPQSVYRASARLLLDLGTEEERLQQELRALRTQLEALRRIDLDAGH